MYNKNFIFHNKYYLKKKFNFNNKKNIYLNNFKKKIILNLFFNINDIDDNLFYIFYDVFYWNKIKKWYLFKPYYLSFFFFYKERIKWKYVRLLNIVNKYILKKQQIKKKINKDIWNIWNFNNKELLKQKVIAYYKFKLKDLNFKFWRYYFFIKNKGLIVFDFNKFYIFKNWNYIIYNNLNYYHYINFLYSWKYKIYYLKNNNKKFLKIFYYCFLISKNIDIFKYLLVLNLLFKNFFYLKKKIFINCYYYLIKEKHKLKNFLYLSKFYFKNYVFWIRELNIFLKFKSKKRLRKKKGEKKLIVKKKFFYKKKRTNNQILKAFIGKFIVIKKLYYQVIYKDFFFNLKQLIFNYYNIYFFITINFYYIDNIFFDMDSLYVYYLPRNRKLHVMHVLTDDFSDLWRGKFNRYVNNYNNFNTKLDDKINNISILNKINIKFIYQYLINDKKDLKKKNKFFFIFKNILTLIRFYKNHFFLLKNLDFIFNVYFWLIIFLNLLNKSKIFLIKKILDYTMFVKLINLIFKNKYNWFDLTNFDIFLNVLTNKNIILKLKCTFSFLLQEVCLYLYYYIFNISYKIDDNKFIPLILKKIKLFKNIKHIFKGLISFENNYFLCLNFIKKNIGNSYFFLIIQNFFYNCKLSIVFIKKNLKLYWNFLELSYKVFDNFIINLLNKFQLKKQIKYIRYKNIVIFCSKLYTVNILKFIINKFIFKFLYYFLQFYFFYCMFINLKYMNCIFLGYVICLKNNKLFMKLSYLEFMQLLIYYNFIKKKDNKLIVKSANYLLNLSIIRIFNYYYNVWLEIIFFYKIKNLNIIRKILYKSCFLTILLKLQKKNKTINFNKFKKIFKFKMYHQYNINIKKLNQYILKYNKFNFKNILNKKK